MNDFQFENLIKGIELSMKENYCAMYFSDLARKFYPITHSELEAAIEAMYNRGKLTTDGSLLRLIIK